MRSGFGIKVRVKGRTYALLALAVMKTLSMCREESCICAMMTWGRYTPDAARAAPKSAPAVEDVSAVRDDIVVVGSSG